MSGYYLTSDDVSCFFFNVVTTEWLFKTVEHENAKLKCNITFFVRFSLFRFVLFLFYKIQ